MGREWARDSNHVTQHQVRSGGVVGGSDARTTARQFRDQIPIRDKVDQGDPHVLQRGIQGMGNGGGDQAPGRECHRLERGGRIKAD